MSKSAKRSLNTQATFSHQELKKIRIQVGAPQYLCLTFPTRSGSSHSIVGKWFAQSFIGSFPGLQKVLEHTQNVGILEAYFTQSISLSLYCVFVLSRSILTLFQLRGVQTFVRKVNKATNQCDQIYCFSGNFLKHLAIFILPKYPTLLGNFCKGVKIFILLVKSFLVTFYWSHCYQPNLSKCQQVTSIDKAQSWEGLLKTIV